MTKRPRLRTRQLKTALTDNLSAGYTEQEIIDYIKNVAIPFCRRRVEQSKGRYALQTSSKALTR